MSQILASPRIKILQITGKIAWKINYEYRGTEKESSTINSCISNFLYAKLDMILQHAYSSELLVFQKKNITVDAVSFK
jgi:hypothetical protein